jgi:hypothetical protein
MQIDEMIEDLKANMKLKTRMLESEKESTDKIH